MSDYISEKIEQYERKLKQAEKAGKHNKAKKYQEKLERLRAEAAEQDTDSDTDSDDDAIDSDDEADNSFAFDEEPDVAPRGLKGASKLEWLGGRGAKKLVADACREAVSEGGARDGFNANSAIRIVLPGHLEMIYCATSNCVRPFSATDRTPATTAGASSSNPGRSRRVREAYRKALRSRARAFDSSCVYMVFVVSLRQKTTLLMRRPSRPAARAAARASS